MSPPQNTPPARDGIYRAIQLLLFLDIVLGLGLAAAGALVLQADSISFTGLGLALIGLALMVFFHLLAARQSARGRTAPRRGSSAGGPPTGS